MLLLSLTLISLQASAQDFVTVPGFVVEALPGSFYANGAGAPTVAYDPGQQVYVMFFETRLTDPDPICKVGQWGLGAATSIDGLSWTVEPDPVLLPETGTSHSCVVAHPVVVLDGSHWRLWFKAEQGSGECGVWGCNIQTGVGYAEARVILATATADQIAALNAAQAQNDADLDTLLTEFSNDPVLDDWLAAADLLPPSFQAAHQAVIDTQSYVRNMQKVLRGNQRKAQTVLTIAADLKASLENLLVVLTPDLADPDVQALYDQTVLLLASVTQLHDELNQLLIIRDDISAQLSALQAGLGQATRITLNARTNPVLNISGFGYPAVSKVGGSWSMLVAKVPDLYLATSSAPDTGWVMNTTPVMQPGVTSWTQDELFNPSMVCEDSSFFQYTLFFGGRNTTNTFIDLGGWGQAISTDANKWWISALAGFQWSGGDKWRHWDATRVGADYLVWFSEKDLNGHNRVGLAYSTPSLSWDPALISARICP